jgi:hypothetical protein
LVLRGKPNTPGLQHGAQLADAFDPGRAARRLGRVEDHAVAVGDGAGAAAGPHPPLQTTPGRVGEVPEEHRAHGALQADMQPADLALSQGDDPHARDDGLLVEAGDVLLVTGEAVEALGEHEVEAPRAHRCAQRLAAGTERRRTRYQMP